MNLLMLKHCFSNYKFVFLTKITHSLFHTLYLPFPWFFSSYAPTDEAELNEMLVYFPASCNLEDRWTILSLISTPLICPTWVNLPEASFSRYSLKVLSRHSSPLTTARWGSSMGTLHTLQRNFDSTYFNKTLLYQCKVHLKNVEYD